MYMMGAIVVVLFVLGTGCSYCVVNIVRHPVIMVWIVFIFMIGFIVCFIICVGILLNCLKFFVIKRIILI